MELKKIEDLVEKGLCLSDSEISGEAFKTLTEFLKKEIDLIMLNNLFKSKI
tara:strand:+ start:43 stop:195 length:153 start_codon:yes stop_codon:yes gene_type:complete